MAGSRRYHHGSLRDALLAAGEAELAGNGVERFSLRAVARRAGVSHAAPAHHFRDAGELLTALAALSYGRFLEEMRRHADAAGTDAVDRLVASGLGYIAYARAHPALFDLQFFSDRPDYADPALAAAARAAYAHLAHHVAAVLAARGRTLADEPDAVAHAWATAHGLAALAARPRPGLPDGPAEERRAAFERILRAACTAL